MQVVNYSESRTAEEICESSSKMITFIDLAGHHKYLKTTIFGLTSYCPDFAMLVVSANTGIGELQFDDKQLIDEMFQACSWSDRSDPQQSTTEDHQSLTSSHDANMEFIFSLYYNFHLAMLCFTTRGQNWSELSWGRSWFMKRWDWRTSHSVSVRPLNH